jgi:hypothetical protein
MEAPHLVISEDDRMASSGKCSACETEFSVGIFGSRSENILELAVQFEAHVLASHTPVKHC